MPNYAKFLKDVMAKKRKLRAYEMVELTEECSATIQKRLPINSMRSWSKHKSNASLDLQKAGYWDNQADYNCISNVHLKNKISSAISAIRSVFGQEENKQDAGDKLERLRERMIKVRELFRDTGSTEFVIVTIPTVTAYFKL
ncbi:hypothetical protein OROMI_005176 [Orobanche minor]